MAIVAGIFSFARPVAAAKMFEAAPHPEFVPGEVLVKFKDDPDIAYAQESLMHDLAARARKMIGNTGISLMQLDKDADIKMIIQQMKSDPRVEYVEPNYIYHATATTPNDPLFDPPANPLIHLVSKYWLHMGCQSAHPWQHR